MEFYGKARRACTPRLSCLPAITRSEYHRHMNRNRHRQYAHLTALLAALMLATLSACSNAPLLSAPSAEDTWSRSLRERWLPQMAASTAAHQDFTRQHGIPTLRARPRFELRSADAKGTETATQTHFLIMKQSMGRSELSRRASLEVLHTLFLQHIQELAEGRQHLTPDWLREGSARYLAENVLASMPEHALLLRNEVDSRESTLRQRDYFSAIEAAFESRQASPQELARAHHWLAEQLAPQGAAPFIPRWLAYFRQAARPDFEHEAAFLKSFGLSTEAFQAQAAEKLLALRQRVRQHADAIPKASGYAAIEDIDTLALTASANAVSGYQRYLRGRAPKAFVFSPRNVWASVDDSEDAIARALAICRSYDPSSCYLYAVDDQVVYTPLPAEQVSIDVVLEPREEDEWHSLVRDRWLPVIKEASELFLREATLQTGHSLAHSASLHVATDGDSYARVMKREMGTLQREAEHFRKHASGLANGKGRIAIILAPGLTTEQMEKRIRDVVLHELVHEWQGQLGDRYRGFRPPPWLIEGSAEVLALRFASETAQRDEEVRNRIQLLKHASLFQLLPGPEMVFSADRTTWRDLLGKGLKQYNAAELMTHFLAQQLGDGFLSALRAHFLDADRVGGTHESAFTSHFGMSTDAFLQAYTQWLKTP